MVQGFHFKFTWIWCVIKRIIGVVQYFHVVFSIFLFKKLLTHILRVLDLATMFGAKPRHGLTAMFGVRPKCRSDIIATTRRGFAWRPNPKLWDLAWQPDPSLLHLGFGMAPRLKILRYDMAIRPNSLGSGMIVRLERFKIYFILLIFF